ncbi:SDR family oxidoreductase [Flagellimonas taeanensis]|uniref:SDR family NAD(P)-dependent oxidoreductase n=1 Tax=Flavobacteriaceae TaxID=49546 RepID=UPI000E6A56A8|nr:MULTISPECIES: SDR family oxidoreductase [Allomuricauda]MDC6386152.1 SDR family NAD(P)-dependent oxidoreductase [Muricauda sp. SK9]RIV50382.1 SDR family oxidoreductase [Allomuricauda taeanensis]
MRFKDKVVLVTGATKNTGVGIAAFFIKEGAKVCINGHSPKSLERGADELRAMGLEGFDQFAADISKEEQVSAMFDYIKVTFGRLDILINNAAQQGLGSTFDSMTSDDFLKVIMVNVFGTFQVSQQAAQLMERQEGKGVIINLGSNVSTRAIHNRTAYVTSKGAIDALTRSMAIDLAGKGIRVNTVAPGYIHTDRWKVLPNAEATRRRMNVPLHQEATMTDISAAVAFLASDEAKNITGERLVVDGGCSAQHLPMDIDV